MMDKVRKRPTRVPVSLSANRYLLNYLMAKSSTSKISIEPGVISPVALLP
jgi:hypothetical protein